MVPRFLSAHGPGHKASPPKAYLSLTLTLTLLQVKREILVEVLTKRKTVTANDKLILPYSLSEVGATWPAVGATLWTLCPGVSSEMEKHATARVSIHYCRRHAAGMPAASPSLAHSRPEPSLPGPLRPGDPSPSWLL